MHINFDVNCSETESTVKDILNRVLGYVDESESKRKDSIRKKIKRNDEDLLPVFDNLIKRKAILCSSKKCSGQSRIFLRIANKKLIAYAINNNLDVPEEEELRKIFNNWILLSSEEIKNLKMTNLKMTKYDYLKSKPTSEGFDLYFNLPLSEFTFITNYFFDLYKAYLQEQERIPVKNPYMTINKNIVITHDDLKTNQENKQYQKKTSSKKPSNKQKKTKEEILESKSKIEKIRQENITKHLEDVQNNLNEIIDKINLEFKCVSVRNRCYNSLNNDNKTTNVLLSKLLMDISSFEKINNISKNIKTLCNIVNKLKDKVTCNLTNTDIETVSKLSSND